MIITGKFWNNFNSDKRLAQTNLIRLNQLTVLDTKDHSLFNGKTKCKNLNLNTCESNQNKIQNYVKM